MGIWAYDVKIDSLDYEILECLLRLNDFDREGALFIVDFGCGVWISMLGD